MRLHETNQMDQTGRSWVAFNYHSNTFTTQRVITVEHLSIEPSLRTRATDGSVGTCYLTPTRERTLPGRTLAPGEVDGFLAPSPSFPHSDSSVRL
jgi:hypothetical protein